jgi:hypothetical protein
MHDKCTALSPLHGTKTDSQHNQILIMRNELGHGHCSTEEHRDDFHKHIVVHTELQFKHDITMTMALRTGQVCSRIYGPSFIHKVQRSKQMSNNI